MINALKIKRILVVGCSGSGKSYFASRLAPLLRLPLYYLDLVWHKADRTTISREEFDRALAEILARDEWIIDGNFYRTLPTRLARSDAVFLFDLPTEDCLEGVAGRIGKKRPDMPWIETEFDPEFRQWIINFKRDRLPGILRELEKFKGETVVFGDRANADQFLAALEDELTLFR